MTLQWRSEAFLGGAREQLAGKRILVAGCGADGSHAAQAIGAISGGNIRLILADPEVYTEANIGIQVANVADVGQNKAAVTARHLVATYPAVETEVFEMGVAAENVEKLVDGVDYVIDATDISVTGIASMLHATACRRSVPVIVPWSLGFGGAIMACTTPGDFDTWGFESAKIANDAGLPELEHVARWLVDVPDEIDLGYIKNILRCEVPTPTTFFGAAAGGHMAARWIAAHCLEPAKAPVFPEVVLMKGDLLQMDTIKSDFRDMIYRNIAKLAGKNVD